MSAHEVYDPVTRRDIMSEAEYAENGWKTFYSIFQRLSAQGAPQELLKEVAEVSDMYMNIYRKLKVVGFCFPTENER